MLGGRNSIMKRTEFLPSRLYSLVQNFSNTPLIILTTGKTSKGKKFLRHCGHEPALTWNRSLGGPGNFKGFGLGTKQNKSKPSRETHCFSQASKNPQRLLFKNNELYTIKIIK